MFDRILFSWKDESSEARHLAIRITTLRSDSIFVDLNLIQALVRPTEIQNSVHDSSLRRQFECHFSTSCGDHFQKQIAGDSRKSTVFDRGHF